jgi:hypothetical protein
MSSNNNLNSFLVIPSIHYVAYMDINNMDVNYWYNWTVNGGRLNQIINIFKFFFAKMIVLSIKKDYFSITYINYYIEIIDFFQDTNSIWIVLY